MSKKTQNILAKAKTQLLIHHPFFAQVALSAKYKITKDVPTMATDGKWILVNPDFTNSLTLDEVIFVLAHEAMHILGMHHLRIRGRNPQKWNYATDYAINALLVAEKLTMPKDGLLDTKYSNKSAEEIYNLIPDESDKDNSGSGFGEVFEAGSIDGNGNPTNQPMTDPADIQQEKQRIKELASRAASAAKMAGKLPAGMERLVDEILTTKTPWKDMLRKYMIRPDKSDYSWSTPNRRFIGGGLYLPAMHSDNGMGEVIVAVDTSGSISNKELALFTGEVQQIIDDAKPSSVTVLYFDTSISHVDEYNEPNAMDINMKAYGGGGTDFRPIFDWIVSNYKSPDVVVVLTDLYGKAPKYEEFDTVWACLPNSATHTPFGSRVDLTFGD